MRAAFVVLLLIVGCRFDRSGVAPSDVPWVRDAVTDERPPLPDAGHRDAPAPDLLADAAPDKGVADSAIPDTGVDPLAPFGAAQPLTALNTNLNEDDPTLTGDMLEIYFDRDNDIWHASRASTSTGWGAAQPVTVLNTPYAETTPSITTDGLTLFFASDRSSGLGGHDVYVSTRAQLSGPRGSPQAVSSLNTSSLDVGPAPHTLLELVLKESPALTRTTGSPTEQRMT